MAENFFEERRCNGWTLIGHVVVRCQRWHLCWLFVCMIGMSLSAVAEQEPKGEELHECFYNFQEVWSELSTGSRFLDASCHPIHPDLATSLFGDAPSNSGEITPVSLYWSPYAQISQLALVQFPLELPTSPGVKGATPFYEWRAGPDLPLLVYDPKRTGTITSARQLFGSYSFGKHWLSGYRALESLDENRDGRLDGEELNDIALWFDKGSDGVSSPGEVVSAHRAGLRWVSVEVDQAASIDGFPQAVAGFGRMDPDKGRIVVGRSIDWISRRYASRDEALSDWARRNQEDGPVVPKLYSWNLPPNHSLGVAGLWEFTIAGNAEQDRPDGIIALSEGDGGRIVGFQAVFARRPRRASSIGSSEADDSILVRTSLLQGEAVASTAEGTLVRMSHLNVLGMPTGGDLWLHTEKGFSGESRFGGREKGGRLRWVARPKLS